jgi:hypothetical protein
MVDTWFRKLLTHKEQILNRLERNVKRPGGKPYDKLLKMKTLQGFLRNFFGTSFRILLDFFANLRSVCEGSANESRMSLCSVPKKTTIGPGRG